MGVVAVIVVMVVVVIVIVVVDLLLRHAEYTGRGRCGRSVAGSFLA